MTTTTPPGYRPDRYIAWCRWMRRYRKTYISSQRPPERTTTTNNR